MRDRQVSGSVDSNISGYVTVQQADPTTPLKVSIDNPSTPPYVPYISGGCEVESRAGFLIVRETTQQSIRWVLGKEMLARAVLDLTSVGSASVYDPLCDLNIHFLFTNYDSERFVEVLEGVFTGENLYSYKRHQSCEEE